MTEKIIITIVLILAAVLVFSGCTKLDQLEDQIENKVDQVEDAIESKLDPVEDAIENALTPTQAPHTDTAAVSDTTAATDSGTTQSSGITEEEAKKIALQHANIAAEDAVFDRVERDFDRGIFHYEIEFRVGYVEYDYDIDAQNGEILSFERD